jgi:hypothetical protein
MCHVLLIAECIDLGVGIQFGKNQKANVRTLLKSNAMNEKRSIRTSD